MLYDGLVDTGLDAPPEEPPPEVEPDTPEPEDSGVGPREDAGPAPEDTGGCQCAAASSGPSPWPLLLVGALLARRRSRIPSGSPW